jgi:hypothetical protein
MFDGYRGEVVVTADVAGTFRNIGSSAAHGNS